MRKFYRRSYSPGLYGEFMKGYYDEKERIENFTTYTNPINFGISNRKRKISEKSNFGFNKALFSINQGNPWKNFLLLKNYLSADELISN